jgi:hypothetical protein
LWGLANLVASTVAESDDTPLYFTDDIGIVFGPPTDYPSGFRVEDGTRVRWARLDSLIVNVKVFSLQRLWALDTLSTTFARHIDKTVFGNAPTHGFWKCANTWPADPGDVASRPHIVSVEPMLCATSFPRVIFSVTMSYLGHSEDMHGCWSIWCFSVIRCS